MIVTLAGHVDHGKTSLVQALTGVETDRLAEEKRRGLTIDLGFAYLEDDDVTLGFVDVPGHHRFIHNMVAGVSAHQHALLVIAADDGPMPQSREHLQILELIGVTEGTIAITKCDRVTAEQLASARERVSELIRGSCLADAPILEVSAPTNAGIEALKARLKKTAQDKGTSTQHDSLFRMPIDRAFTVSGAGVVVTGTVHGGQVNEEQTLTLFPAMKEVRVKSIRTQDHTTVSATAGDRTAINLAGVDIESVARGQWLTTDAASSSEFTLELKVLEDFPRSVRHWLPVHLYHATTHATGHIALLSADRIAPGEAALVELVTKEPLLLRRGDRLVIRDQGLDRTLGGGRVVSTQPATGRRRSQTRLAQLAADTASDEATSLSNHLAIGAVEIGAFERNWGLSTATAKSLIDQSDAVVRGGYAIRRAIWAAWLDELLDEIEQRHKQDAALQGLKQSEIGTDQNRQFVAELLAELVAEDKLVTGSGRYQPAEHKVSLSEPEQQLFERVRPLLDQAQPPSLGDMAKQFRLSVGDLAKRLHPLVAKKYLVRISDTRYYLPAHLEAMAQLALNLNADGPFTVRQYRDASGIGRNVAIEVLEYFDRSGFTRRDEQTRKVVGTLSF